MLWEILKASKGILVADFYADLWANIAGGGTPVDVFVEMIGSLPLYYNGKGYDLADYLISGNAVQDGTPSADAPVDATGSGVRTGNLWSVPIVQGAVNNKGDFQNSNTRVRGEYIPVQPETQYTISCNKGIRMIYAYQNESKVGQVYDGFAQNTVVTFTTPTNCNSVCVGIMNDPNTAIITPSDIEFVMLNLGSTALPYEPYGYKLPVTVNGTEHPIYLGQVETTRRIKKQVLTGDESWYSSSRYIGSLFAYYSQFPGIASRIPIYCSHLIAVDSVSQYQRGTCICDASSVSLWIFDTATSPASFKSYLAAQYAAGTPVTVWYVLAEPETGVVNEPLMKIGDYADTVSFAQAGVTIPTVSGANVLDMTSPVKPSEVYIKGKGIKPMEGGS